MDLLTIFVFAIGLCFDSFAVSVSCGMSRHEFTKWRGVRFAIVLAIFQAVMPLIGWALATEFHKVIEAYDHWVAFVLLAILGGKMIKESFSADGDGCCEGATDQENGNPFRLRRSVVLGVATSIDALIAGVAMAMVPLTISVESSQLTNMIIAITIIGIVTFLASGIGLFIGSKSRSKLGRKAELIGGVILIAIGVKVLIEHLG